MCWATEMNSKLSWFTLTLNNYPSQLGCLFAYSNILNPSPPLNFNHIYRSNSVMIRRANWVFAMKVNFSLIYLKLVWSVSCMECFMWRFFNNELHTVIVWCELQSLYEKKVFNFSLATIQLQCKLIDFNYG